MVSYGYWLCLQQMLSSSLLTLRMSNVGYCHWKLCPSLLSVLPTKPFMLEEFMVHCLSAKLLPASFEQIPCSTSSIFFSCDFSGYLLMLSVFDPVF